VRPLHLSGILFYLALTGLMIFMNNQLMPGNSVVNHSSRVGVTVQIDSAKSVEKQILQQPENIPPALTKYRKQLQAFREEFRSKEMPAIPFFLFGMGNRMKLLYKNGVLKNSISGEIVKEWPVKNQIIIPNEYQIILQTAAGQFIIITENEKGVFLDARGNPVLIGGTASPIQLPAFEGHKYSEILKVLHHEILINIIESKPVPNYFVYPKPWRRDAAMMAMCLDKTGNLQLIQDWVLSLVDPYDHNNQANGIPENEADNLGQTLYLLSLFTDKTHPLVPQILTECRQFEVNETQGKFIQGRSDFQEVPVYQTKWLKFGLKALGLADPYTIPQRADNYSSLFWWAYQDTHIEGNAWTDDKYPYIGWARDHFYQQKKSPISNRDYPLTWEIQASQANYEGMRPIDEIYVTTKTASPHTWHAAEIFLYLLQ